MSHLIFLKKRTEEDENREQDYDCYQRKVPLISTCSRKGKNQATPYKQSKKSFDCDNIIQLKGEMADIPDQTFRWESEPTGVFWQEMSRNPR